MATIDAAAAAMAAAMPISDILDDEEFVRMWVMGMNAERAVGRPKDWDGKESGFDTFVFKFANWLAGLPGNTEELLDYASKHDQEIAWPSVGRRQKVVAQGVAQALKSMVDGKALDIVKSVPEKQNGFEMWRRLFAEYRPQSAGRKVCLLESVMDGRPKDGEDFSTWYYRWTELMRQTERARGKPIDDDIKCAVALRRAPLELRNHLVLQTSVIADRFAVMNEIITTWMIARRMFPSHSPSQPQTHKDPNAMDVGAVSAKAAKTARASRKARTMATRLAGVASPTVTLTVTKAVRTERAR